MPTTNTNFSTLISAIDTKAQSLASSTTDPKDLVFLGKAIEAMTVPDTVSEIISEGDTQIADVNSAGTTQVGNVNTAGTTQVGNVNTAGTTQVAAINSAASTYSRHPSARLQRSIRRWLRTSLYWLLPQARQ